MRAMEVIEQAKVLGVELTVEGNNIRYKALTGTMTPELKEAIREHKTDILQLLSPSEQLARVTPYHKPDETLPLLPPTKKSVTPSKPQPEHYCYMCEYLEIMGSTWQWDRGIRNWVCSNFSYHTPTKKRIEENTHNA